MNTPTPEQTMASVLTRDGYRFQIVRDDLIRFPVWRLWISDGSVDSNRGARHLVPSVVFSLEETEAAATADIAEQVVLRGWPEPAGWEG